MTELHEKDFYDILNTQYNCICKRAQAIENKAITVTGFTGVVLGLEFNFLNNFSSSILVNNVNYSYHLVLIGASFFFSSTVFAIATIIESHNFYKYDVSCFNECYGENGLITKLTFQIKDSFKENERKIESKEKLLKFSIILFLLGVCITICIFFIIMRHSFHPNLG